MNPMSNWLVKASSDWRLIALRTLRAIAWMLPALWLSHGTAAQAQSACAQVAVLNHSTYQAFRTNSASGSCTLPSGVVMTWSHAGDNRGLQSFGCTSYDPTYWMDGGTMTVTFSQPVNNVGFITWGLDGTDSAAVTVGGPSTQAPPQALSNEFVDLCPGHSGGSAPTVVGNLVQGTGGGYYGQIGVRASSAAPYTVIQLAITGTGGGFGLVGVSSPVPIVPSDPSPAAGPTEIPTLSEWGLVILASLMALGGLWVARRRRV